MKNLILILALLLCLKTKAQFQNNMPWYNGQSQLIDKDTLAKRVAAPKIKYTHVLIYRQWSPYDHYGDYKYTTVAFQSLNALKTWLNTSYWEGGTPDVRLKENEIVSIYDLENAKEIKVKLKTEEKVKAKERIIEEEKWTERQYIIEK